VIIANDTVLAIWDTAGAWIWDARSGAGTGVGL